MIYIYDRVPNLKNLPINSFRYSEAGRLKSKIKKYGSDVAMKGYFKSMVIQWFIKWIVF